MALASTVREAEEMLKFLFTKTIANAAIKNVSTLSLTVGEWGQLFGSQSRVVKTHSVNQLAAMPEFTQQLAPLETSLRLTIGEANMHSSWSRPWTKAAAMLAMNVEEYEEFLSSNLGGVVKADSRRLEDLQHAIDEAGLETLLLSRVIVALAECVT